MQPGHARAGVASRWRGREPVGLKLMASLAHLHHAVLSLCGGRSCAALTQCGHSVPVEQDHKASHVSLEECQSSGVPLHQ